jgi:hypothetical protein
MCVCVCVCVDRGVGATGHYAKSSPPAAPPRALAQNVLTTTLTNPVWELGPNQSVSSEKTTTGGVGGWCRHKRQVAVMVTSVRAAFIWDRLFIIAFPCVAFFDSESKWNR